MQRNETTNATCSVEIGPYAKTYTILGSIGRAYVITSKEILFSIWTYHNFCISISVLKFKLEIHCNFNR